VNQKIKRNLPSEMILGEFLRLPFLAGAFLKSALNEIHAKGICINIIKLIRSVLNYHV
jgi:hypothetical protein